MIIFSSTLFHLCIVVIFMKNSRWQVGMHHKNMLRFKGTTLILKIYSFLGPCGACFPYKYLFEILSFFSDNISYFKLQSPYVSQAAILPEFNLEKQSRCVLQRSWTQLFITVDYKNCSLKFYY